MQNKMRYYLFVAFSTTVLVVFPMALAGLLASIQHNDVITFVAFFLIIFSVAMANVLSRFVRRIFDRINKCPHGVRGGEAYRKCNICNEEVAAIARLNITLQETNRHEKANIRKEK